MTEAGMHTDIQPHIRPTRTGEDPVVDAMILPLAAAARRAGGPAALRLRARDGRLATIDMLDAVPGAMPGAVLGGPVPDVAPPPVLREVLREAAAQLSAYLEGALRSFDLPLAPAANPFQARVRAAMLEIPWGEVASYGGIAMAIGSSARAVGGACGRNPLPIVVPCHRVLAAGGRLGGYSGGRGLSTKRFLLALEGTPGLGL